MHKGDANSEVAVRLCGVGGQGIVLAANLLAESLSKQFARVTTYAAYGPEVRGTSVHADVRASERWVDYPPIERPSFIIALAQEGYALAVKAADENARVLYDPATVQPGDNGTVAHTPVAASQLSEENFGSPANANLIMLGAASAYLAGFDFDALIHTVKGKFSDSNTAVRALEIGREALRDKPGTETGGKINSGGCDNDRNKRT